jgi:hypothetical protein
MADDWLKQRAERQQAQMLDWLGRHDGRSGALMIVTVAMMGALSAATPAVKQWNGLFLVGLGLSAVGFGTVMYNILRGQVPRIRKAKPSLAFFGTIAAMTQDEFQKRFMAMTQEEYIEDLLANTYVNARIIRSKFRCLTRALVALMLTAVPWAWTLSMAKSL